MFTAKVKKSLKKVRKLKQNLLTNGELGDIILRKARMLFEIKQNSVLTIPQECVWLILSTYAVGGFVCVRIFCMHFFLEVHTY